ncbi:helix-turn-helix transcriptional regulator [Hyphomonas sp. FCG-A18]|jgi:phage repressor protein C with HTH and peptisase S24 domain|uniref:S24 family peptidase n=1 Tax=Hyphomonas sp. FCG-A18 TaxID=3080019 RepID=UPI002B314D65|nr:helix-turn-helix transcriptional regulator [Hyphomonas sp. FCG-A18]
MRHTDIWRGLDAIAEHHEMSVSGLARLAGLDPTSFNKSKRESRDGRARWPSTESLARVLEAVDMGFDDFARLVEGRLSITAPLLGFAQAGSDGFFDDAGFPIDAGWERVRFPGVDQEDGLYALEISGNSMEPAYRAGDRIIVSPATQIHLGDRVVAKTVAGEVMAKTLQRQSAKAIELASLNPDHALRTFRPSEIAWMARILWVSQ